MESTFRPDAALFDRLAPAAHRRARALLGDDPDAWEVVDRVFRRARVPAERPMAWLYRASTGAAVDLWLTQGARSAPQHGEKLRALLAAHGEQGLLQAVLAELDGLSPDDLAAVGVVAGAKGQPAEHLSPLALDELAAGLAESTHLGGCESCQAALAGVRAERERLLATAAFARAREVAVERRKAWWRGLAPIVVPMVAGVVFLLIAMFTPAPKSGPPPGGPSVALQPAQARPGQTVSVQLDRQGYAYALVLSVDADRHIEAVGETLTAGPGPIAVHAFFSHQPLEPAAIVPALEQAVVEYAGWPLDAKPPVPPGGAVATARLYVAQ